jgi:hypothetical protein
MRRLAIAAWRAAGGPAEPFAPTGAGGAKRPSGLANS